MGAKRHVKKSKGVKKASEVHVTEKSASQKRSYLWILKVLVSVAVLFALSRLIDFKLLADHLHAVTWAAVAAVILLIPFSIGIRALRFQWILKRKVSFASAYKITLVGETLNTILPASSGDIAKAYYGYKAHNMKEEMVSATIIDKISGLLGLLILGAITAFWHGYTILGAIFFAGAVIGSAFYFFPAIIPWNFAEWSIMKIKPGSLDIKKLRSSFGGHDGIKYLALVVSIIAWLISYFHLYLITQLFGINVNPLFLVSIAPLINLSRLFPLSFAGLGVQEGVTTYLFSLAGIPAALAIVTSLVFTLCTTILPGLVGLYFVWKMKSKA